MNEDAIYDAISREAKAIHQLLGIGLTSLRKANMDNPGTYYAGFATLTLGIERACKLTMTVDSWVKTGQFLTDAELRKYLHKVPALIGQVVHIGSDSTLDIGFDLAHDDLTTSVVDFFGTASSSEGRYRNLSYLGAALNDRHFDLVAEWSALIKKHAPSLPMTKARQRLYAAAQDMDRDRARLLILQRLRTADNTPITTAEQGYAYVMEMEAVQQHGTLVSAQIARFCVESLVRVTERAREHGKHVPWLEEIFTVLRQRDSILRKRRKFDSYY